MESQSSDYVTDSECCLHYSLPLIQGVTPSFPIQIISGESNTNTTRSSLPRSTQTTKKYTKDDASSYPKQNVVSKPRKGSEGADVKEVRPLAGTPLGPSTKKRGRGRPRKVSNVPVQARTTLPQAPHLSVHGGGLESTPLLPTQPLLQNEGVGGQENILPKTPQWLMLMST